MTALNIRNYQNSALIPSYGHTSCTHKNPLAIVKYCNAPPSLSLVNGNMNLTIPCNASDITEYWCPITKNSAMTFQKESYVAENNGWCADGENIFAAYIIPDQPELSLSSEHAYKYLIELTQKLGYTNIYRIWNYIGRINTPNINGLERYRDFCTGRANAFEALNYAPSTLPAATGIGFHDGGIAIFLIARKTPEAINIENSLQIPAYQYPQCYGPKSPSFARATMIDTQDGQRLYISGTASIRQHASLTDSLEQQISITIENIQNIIKTLRADSKYPKEYLCDSLKIYVRHEQDAALISAAFQDAFNIAAKNAPVLIADICRSELSLEVEGVFRS